MSVSKLVQHLYLKLACTCNYKLNKGYKYMHTYSTFPGKSRSSAIFTSIFSLTSLERKDEVGRKEKGRRKQGELSN